MNREHFLRHPPASAASYHKAQYTHRKKPSERVCRVVFALFALSLVVEITQLKDYSMLFGTTAIIDSVNQTNGSRQLKPVAEKKLQLLAKNTQFLKEPTERRSIFFLKQQKNFSHLKIEN